MAMAMMMMRMVMRMIIVIGAVGAMRKEGHVDNMAGRALVVGGRVYEAMPNGIFPIGLIFARERAHLRSPSTFTTKKSIYPKWLSPPSTFPRPVLFISPSPIPSSVFTSSSSSDKCRHQYFFIATSLFRSFGVPDVKSDECGDEGCNRGEDKRVTRKPKGFWWCGRSCLFLKGVWATCHCPYQSPLPEWEERAGFSSLFSCPSLRFLSLYRKK